MNLKCFTLSFWIYSALSLILLLTLIFVVFWGIQPKSIPKIKLSSSNSPSEFGIFIHHRLRQELNSAPVILLGIDSEKVEQVDLAIGFIESLRSEHPNIELFVDSECNLKGKINSVENINTDLFLKEIINQLKSRPINKKQFLLISSVANSNLYSKTNWIHEIRKVKNSESAISISITDFSYSRMANSNQSHRCNENSENEISCSKNMDALVRSKILSILHKKSNLDNLLELWI